MKPLPWLEQAEDVDFIVKTAIERDPNKRRVKPVEQACILDFDEESSDDSDFRIEDHAGVSDDDDVDSLNSGGDDSGEESSEEESGDDSEIEKLEELRNLNSPNGLSSVADAIDQANQRAKLYFNENDANLLICCGCLGDHSDGVNEIVECDSCGVTVHEACYGVAESTSVGSTNSLSPTAPWFCETCRAGVREPICELCPNSGGIFKETDVGKWVHLICALYVPGVAFGEVDKLTSVTLFEMPYSKWGAKTCSLCPDERFARTGVCIGCDAGMCRTYFHVTCKPAQLEGLEVDQYMWGILNSLTANDVEEVTIDSQANWKPARNGIKLEDDGGDSCSKRLNKPVSPGSMTLPTMNNWDIGQAMSPYLPPDMNTIASGSMIGGAARVLGGAVDGGGMGPLGGAGDYLGGAGPLSHLTDTVNTLDPLNAIEKSLNEQMPHTPQTPHTPHTPSGGTTGPPSVSPSMSDHVTGGAPTANCDGADKVPDLPGDLNFDPAAVIAGEGAGQEALNLLPDTVVDPMELLSYLDPPDLSTPPSSGSSGAPPNAAPANDDILALFE